MTDAKNIQRSLEHCLKQAGYEGPYQRYPLAGGDINDTFLLTTASGLNVCVKQNSKAPEDFFICEAESLAAIEATGTLRVPKVLAVQHGIIVMEYLKPAPPREDYWQQLGEQLAAMHLQTSSQFGFTRDNYCGRLPQPNNRTEDGYHFFREQRLFHQAKMAMDNGELTAGDFEQITKFGERLPELIPPQAPALLHGDLWAGNIHRDSTGRPAALDPAAYWGWPEADLAMTLLFGGFAEDFYHSYEEQRPLESGWRHRAEIYNIYHLLNHANHFGGAYARRAMEIVRRYSGS